MTALAIYDMDKTITRRPTWTPFMIFAARRLAPWRLLLLPVAGVVSIGFLIGLVDRARLKQINQRLLIGSSTPTARMAQICEAFADETLGGNVYPQALALVAADREAGRRLVLATASYAYYVAPLARRLGFDDVIATASACDPEGTILARIEGENCYAAAKLAMIEAWLAGEGIARDVVKTRFYSDSASDLPVLDWADEPIAVNPSARLRRIAEQRGWPIYAWG